MSSEAALDRALPAAPPLGPVVCMGDLAPHGSERRIVMAERVDHGIGVRWDDGAAAEFHPLWLRSECACAECRDRVTLERTYDHFLLPLELEASAVEVSADGALRVVWSEGGHVSWFDPGWLWARGPGRRTAEARRQPWGAALRDALPIFDHAAVMTEDRAFHAWLVTLRDVGLALLRGVPCESGEVERIARRVAFPRDNNFGAIFDVVTMAAANSNAYTAIELPPHVDLPTREYQPGFQFFHCLENRAAGGESLYVDGFALAEQLRADDPDSFHLLSTTPIDFRFYDQASDYVWQAPVIGLDPEGELREIRFNPWLTAPLAVAPERFVAVYRALRRFDELGRDPRFQIRLRLEPGIMAAFDNRRILHGRTAFDQSSGRRHFQGCYLEREEVESRIRVLERTL